MIWIKSSSGQPLSALPTNDLHTVRRWIAKAASEHQASQISRAQIESAAASDLRWILAPVRFRGQPVTPAMAERWIGQFPTSLQPTALRLVHEVAARYFVNESSFYLAIEDVIGRARIPRGASVHFCGWQLLSKSAPRIAHEIKTQAGWKTAGEIDLSQPATWPTSAKVEWLVLADDFVGSGSTLRQLYRKHIQGLLDCFPAAQIRILLLLAYESGIRAARAAWVARRELSNRVQICCHRLLTDRDRCFSPLSAIVIDPARRAELREFCTETAVTRMNGLQAHLALGYDETGALVAFHDSVPNNSLPLLWCDRGSWVPLFPRAGLPPGL